MGRSSIDGTIVFDTAEVKPQTVEPGGYIDRLNAEAPRPVTRYNTFAIPLTSGNDPTILLGADVSRKRALISTDADVTGVQVGPKTALTGGAAFLGFLIPKNTAMEIFSTEDIYVKYSAISGGATSVFVYVYVENRD